MPGVQPQKDKKKKSLQLGDEGEVGNDGSREASSRSTGDIFARKDGDAAAMDDLT